jgi:hypothetical protein
MRLLLSVLVLTIPFLFQQNPTPVFDCVVTDVKGGEAITVCDISKTGLSGAGSMSSYNRSPFAIPLESWPEQWKKPERGLIVRAAWGEKFQPLPCKSNEMHGLYDRPALNSGRAMGERESGAVDCTQPPSAFIRDLLERMNKQ